MASLGSLLDGLAVAITAAGAGVYAADIALAANQTYNNNYVAPILTSYPHDLPSQNKVVAMLFHFYQYERPSILNAPTLISLGSIALPLPDELVDNVQEHYAAENSGQVLGGILEGLAGKNNMSTKAWDSVRNATQGVASNALTRLTSDFGGQASVNQGLSMVGLVQNPFLSMLFKSPQFKRFAFTWTFNPENASDSNTLNFILKKLRYHAMPGMNSAAAGTFLNYPDMCVPVILPPGFMFDFKQCVIETVSINYTPGDTPAFFDSTMAPTSIKLSISLIEIEYWTKPDMTNFQAPGGLSSLTQAGAAQSATAQATQSWFSSQSTGFNLGENGFVAD